MEEAQVVSQTSVIVDYLYKKYGQKSLTSAIQEGYLGTDIFSYLIHLGADVRSTLVSYVHYTPVLKLLEMSGANLSFDDSHLLNVAVKHGLSETVEFLLSRGVTFKYDEAEDAAYEITVNRKDYKMLTLITPHLRKSKYHVIHALKNGWIEAASLLLQHGAPVDDEVFVESVKTSDMNVLVKVVSFYLDNLLEVPHIDVEIPAMSRLLIKEVRQNIESKRQVKVEEVSPPPPLIDGLNPQMFDD